MNTNAVMTNGFDEFLRDRATTTSISEELSQKKQRNRDRPKRQIIGAAKWLVVSLLASAGAGAAGCTYGVYAGHSWQEAFNLFVGALAAGPLVAICFGFILLVVWARMETRYAAVQQVTGGKVDELVKNDPLAAARFGGWVAAIVGASWHVGDETSTAGFAAATCGGLLVLGWLWLGGMLCPHSQRSANAVPSDTR